MSMLSKTKILLHYLANCSIVKRVSDFEGLWAGIPVATSSVLGKSQKFLIKNGISYDWTKSEK